MTRGRLLAAGIAAVTLVLVAVLAAVFVPRWWRGDGGSYAPRHMVVQTSVAPRRSLFGQVVNANVRIVVDPRRIDPKSVRVDPDFHPFAIRSESDTRSRIGRAAVLSYRYELQCVVAACVPRGGAGRSRAAADAVSFRPVRIAVQTREGKVIRSAHAWPVLGVQSRLTAQDIALGEPRVETPFVAPAVTWRVDPLAIGVTASALAVLLILGAGVLVASVALTDRRPMRVLRIPRHLTPVERALALAEHAVRRGETDEGRKALERLAVELRRRGSPQEADDAERLAWSEGRPTPESVAVLADEVRSNGAH
jgi:hypothetical protein